jgi:anti-sigma factor RsiW
MERNPMSDVRKEEMVRLSMRRELTPDEESRLELYFVANPQARTEWEEDRALGRALQSLPDVPVPSNFTSRVLQEVELDDTREVRRPVSPWWRGWFPKLGWATAALLMGALVLQHQTVQQQRIVDDLATLSDEIKHSPAPEVLQDFEVIERLRRAATPSDDELLAALQ